MPALSTTEIIGFNNQVVQYLETSKADLQAKGLDVSSWVTELKAVNTDTITKDAEQDQLKTALTVKTKETKAVAKNNYQMTSTRVDAVIGVLGKGTTAAKQFAKLRSDLLKVSERETREDKSKPPVS